MLVRMSITMCVLFAATAIASATAAEEARTNAPVAAVAVPAGAAPATPLSDLRSVLISRPGTLDSPGRNWN